MKTVVVPVNFSPWALNAARYAADLALAIKADIRLIHVIQAPVYSANNSLQQLQAELDQRTGHQVNIVTTLATGSIEAKIKEICQEIKPHVIVLGATGPTLEKFWAGSPVAFLLHDLKDPVLVVPEDATFQPFRRILLACDLEDIGSAIPDLLPLLKNLSASFGCRIDLITVETRKMLTEEQYVFEPGCWKDQLKDLDPHIHYLRKSTVEEGIHEYLSFNDADLIMVFPKNHGLFDFHLSQSRKMAQHNSIPVLSLHA